ncbi:MAG TPA: extracellular solute-binding protein [Thermomicrobiales bacterium]|nr:extracellular solute-binding protein [Thermomicrobiales bacterium]
MNRFEQTLSRRTFVGGIVAAGVGMRVVQPSTAAADKTLRLLCWAGYDDPEITKAFRDQTGFAVQSTYLGANDEIFLDLRAGGLGTIDVVTPQNGVIADLVASDLIQPLDYDRLPNSAGYLQRFHLPEWAVVDGKPYAAPFLWGTAPAVYNADALPQPPENWLDLLSSTYRGRLAIPDDGLGHFKIWNRALGAADPVHVTQSQLIRTTNVLVSLKAQQAIALTADMTVITGLVASGAAWLSTIGWEAIPHSPTAAGARLKLAYPAPGCFSSCYSFCLAKDAPNLDAAYAFIDSLISPDVQAIAAAKLWRGTVNEQAISHLTNDAHALFPYDNLDPFFELNPLLGFPPLQEAGEGMATYVDWVEAWERVHFGKLGKPAGS